ncbi:MAG TPA: response regulator [Thermoanaerobaculia bacterium]
MEAEERAAREREEAEREKAQLEAARIEAEQRAAREREEAERAMQARLEQEREAMRLALEQQLAAEREAMSKEAEARIEEAARAAVPPQPPSPPPPAPSKPAPAAPKHSILHAVSDTVSGWFHREPRTRPNLATKRLPSNGTATKRTPAPPPRRSASPHPPKVRRPRLVMLERRRGTADTILPKLRQRGIEATVVERWVDAVDELLRVKPDALLLDVEHPDFEKAHRTTMEKSANLPIVLTGRSTSAAPANVAYASFATRPYDSEELMRIAEQAMSRPDELLAVQMIQRTPAAAPKPIPVATVAPAKRPEPPRQDVVVAMKPGSNEEYEVQCYTCRVGFNAVESDWCSCLAKERTLVCTNCLTCFCKAPPAYKEKFWVEAPPRLFERKTAEGRKNGGLGRNPGLGEVTRPLVLTVEDDEEIQAIVQRVCANLGYGFIYATNGQDGLELAHEYRPNLILSDAFMPKLDGREMCRMLKDEAEFADTRMVVMTGLYTDTKYRSEALKRFHVDDYVAKPVAITDLINLLQKHLEGVTGLPMQDDLHEMHRQELLEEMEEIEDVPLSEVLAAPDSPQMQIAAPAPAAAPAHPDAYEVCCANCEQTYDATRTEWCRCVGRDNTLVCNHCGGCFCKAPAAYKERFWSDAPPSLFERKMIGSKRSLGARVNPAPGEVKRPLILLVEDDENVQLIVRTVVTTMGFGFVVGANGQEGLSLAREYSPDLILSDAFMPKLDGREMCRLLKEDPTTARSKAIVMTGLYTDRKYRNEALDYFKVDDYVAKPLAVDDLIKLFKKHLPQEVATAH